MLRRNSFQTFLNQLCPEFRQNLQKGTFLIDDVAIYRHYILKFTNEKGKEISSLRCIEYSVLSKIKSDIVSFSF